MTSCLDSVIEPALSGCTNRVCRTDVQRLRSLVIRYVFRHISASEYTSAFREAVPESNPKTTRLKLLANGAVLKNVKLFAYADANLPAIQPKPYGVSVRDSNLVRTTLENETRFTQYLRKLHRTGYKSVTPPKLDATLGAVLTHPEMDAYLGKFIYRKLRFIVQTTGTTTEDIKQDLMGWATYALYRAYPRVDSFLHATNIAKQAIHNRGINLIKEATTKSRQRLVTNPDGTFSSLTVPLHSMNGSPTLDGGYLTQTNYLIVDVTGKTAEDKTLANLHDDVDLKMAVKKCYKELPETYKRLLKLWAGFHDEEFSLKLGFANDEWYDTADRMDYPKRSSDFLGLTRTEAKTFYRQLRTKFADFATPRREDE